LTRQRSGWIEGDTGQFGDRQDIPQTTLTLLEIPP
jgi:hypothetical protein